MLNWLSHLFQPRRQTLHRQIPHIEAVAMHHDWHGGDKLAQIAQSGVYQQSPYVYVAVNRIAEAAALVPLKIFRLQGEQRLEVENHPLERLLANPNPYLSQFELLEQTLGFLELMGNAYWYLAGDARGLPAEIWLLHPDRITIVPDPQHYIRGYLYAMDGKQIPLDPVEVVHFKRWHPANDYYGLSALEAARLAIQSDRAMAHWNYNTFGKDNGVPAGVVSIKDFISDADFERLKREWRSSYGGTSRRTAFLRGGSVEWQNIGLTHTELDFLQGRKTHRDEILNIFGIPVGLISENATEANAKVAERLFIERTLYPKLVRLAQKITQEILPFYPGDHLAAFEDIRPTDMQTRLNEIRTAQNVLSINEIREKYYHLPAVTWGDLPVNLTAKDTKKATSDEQTAASEMHGANRPTQNSELGTEDLALETQPLENGASKNLIPATISEELAQWERFALKRLTRPHSRPFTVALIPAETAFDISAELLLAHDKDAVKAIFARARAMLMPN
jgi:HK97 family phage portal protein